MSETVGAMLQWDEAWLVRHCRAKSTGACRLIDGRSGGVAGEVHGNAPRVVNRHHYRKDPAGAIYVGRRTPLGNPDPKPAALSLEAEVLARGWIVVDDHGREILAEAEARWGRPKTLRGIVRLLAGGEPTFALESIGAALGPEFECPLQLVPVSSEDRPPAWLADPIGDYRRWLNSKIRGKDPAVLAAMRAIRPDSLLVCSCWPRPCHADVIRSAWCWMRRAGML